MRVVGNYGWLARNALNQLSSVVPLEDIPIKAPRTGIVILATLLNAMSAGAKISLFGFEVAERKEGAEHFFSDGRKFHDLLNKWEKYNCPMTYEFDTLIAMRDRGLMGSPANGVEGD